MYMFIISALQDHCVPRHWSAGAAGGQVSEPQRGGGGGGQAHSQAQCGAEGEELHSDRHPGPGDTQCGGGQG